MELLCPSCQRQLTIPEQYAGQQMKCPLCGHTFTAPALAPVPAPAAPPPPVTAPAPAAVGGGPASTLAVIEEEAHAPPPVPAAPPPIPGEDRHRLSIWLSPRVLPWVALGAFAVVFFFTLLPWIRMRRVFDQTTGAQEAWEAAFGTQANGLLILYLLLLILVLLLAIAAVVLPALTASLPPGAQRLLPWRWGLVAAVALLAYLFLVVQVLVGFRVEQDYDSYLVYRTFFLTLTLWLHLVGIVCALLTFRGDLRHDRPIPRIDVLW